MRRIAMLFAACAALAAAGTAAPEKEDPVIAPEDAAEFVGQEMTVAGAVTGTHLSKRSGNLYLNLGDYRKTVSIKIPKAAVAKFPANAETWYTGKKINATGMISRERGLLRLTVSAPSALKVVE
jgi:hypothetical protein